MIVEKLHKVSCVEKFGCKVGIKVVCNEVIVLIFGKPITDRHGKSLFGAVSPVIGDSLIRRSAENILGVYLQLIWI